MGIVKPDMHLVEANNNYPRPAVPLSPVLSWYSVNLEKSTSDLPSILDCKYKLQLTSGRAAIALALKHIGVGKGDEVLLPAFHCESMVAPIRWVGAKPVFYRVNKNASVNVDNIAIKTSAKTRALIITHYFGTLQDLDSVQALCRENNVMIIEDCAHAFFGSNHGTPVGSVGDYAIASSMKFFPVLDGGLLASNTRDVTSIEVQRPPLSFEIKSFLNSIETSIGYKRFGLLGRLFALMITIKEIGWKITKIILGQSKSSINTPASSQGGQSLDEAWIRMGASITSKIIVAQSDRERIIELRRSNYKRFDKALGELPGCHAFQPHLSTSCVPLVYPLWVDEPEKIFGPLKKQAVPIWRFGEYLDKEVTSEVCSNSIELSAHLFQFPCHQELRDDEIEWIITQVTNTVNSMQNKGK